MYDITYLYDPSYIYLSVKNDFLKEIEEKKQKNFDNLGF